MKKIIFFNSITTRQQFRSHLSQIYLSTGLSKLQKAKEILKFPDGNAHDFQEIIYYYILHNDESLSKSAMYMLAIMVNYKFISFAFKIKQDVSEKLIRLASENCLQIQYLKHLFKIDILNDLLIKNAQQQLGRQETDEMKYVLLLTNLCKYQLETLTYNSILLSKNLDSQKMMKTLQKTLSFYLHKTQKHIQLYLNLLVQQIKLIKEYAINNKNHDFHYQAKKIIEKLHNIVQIYHGDQISHKDTYLNDQIYRNYYMQFQLSICISLNELFQSGLQVYNNYLIDIIEMLSITICSFKFSKMVKKLILCSTQNTFIEINKFQANGIQCRKFYRNLFNNVLLFVCSQSELKFIKQPNFLQDQIRGDVVQVLFCIIQKISDSTFIRSLQVIGSQYDSEQSRAIIDLLRFHYDIKKKVSIRMDINFQQDLQKQINNEINHVLQLQNQNQYQDNKYYQRTFQNQNQNQDKYNQRKYLKINFLLVCLRKRLNLSLQTKNYFLKDQNFTNCLSFCIKLFISQKCVAQSAQLLIQLFKKKFIDKTNHYIVNVVDTNDIIKIHQYFIQILRYFKQNRDKMKILKESVFQQIIKLLITLLKQRLPFLTEPIFAQIFNMIQYLDGSSNLKFVVELFEYSIKLSFDNSNNIIHNVQNYAQRLLNLSNKRGQQYLIKIFLMFIQKFKTKSLRTFLKENQRLFNEINLRYQICEQEKSINSYKFQTQISLFQQINTQQIKQVFKILLCSKNPLSYCFILKMLNYLEIAFNYYNKKQDNPQIKKQISLQVFDIYSKQLPKFFIIVEETVIFGKSLFDKINCLSKILKLLILTLNSRQFFNKLQTSDFQNILQKIKCLYQKISNFAYKIHNGTDQSIQKMSRFQQAKYNLGKLLLLTLALYSKQVNFTNSQEIFYFEKYLNQERQMMQLIENKSKKTLQMHVNIKKDNLMFYNEQLQCFWPLLAESLLKFQRY